MELMIVEQSGWKKPVKIEKAVTRLGSAPSNDIQLNSPNIAPYQLQIIYSSDTPSVCKVLNLGATLTLVTRAGERSLEPYITLEASDRDEIVLDNYRLVFTLPVSATLLSASAYISASFHMADALLRADAPAVGRLLISNAGAKTASQFHVTVNNFPEDCYRIDPVPLLYPGAQEEVRIQFFHRKIYPSAGIQDITIVISAPATYPGEQVIIRQGLYVAPVLNHKLDVVDDMPVPHSDPLRIVEQTPEALPDALPPEPPSPEVTLGAQPAESSLPVAAAVAETPEVEPEPVPEPVSPVRDVSQLKVVKNPTSSYWDETNQ